MPTRSQPAIFTIRPATSSAEATTVQLSLVGELDMTAAAALANAIEGAVSQGRHVVLDCSPLTFIDASGLGTILLASRHAIRCGRTVRVVNVPPAIRRTFHLARLDFMLREPDDRHN